MSDRINLFPSSGLFAHAFGALLRFVEEHPDGAAERFLLIAERNPEGALVWAEQRGIEIPDPLPSVIRNRRAMAAVSGLIGGLAASIPGDAEALHRAEHVVRIGRTWIEPERSLVAA
jgi:hypothetical protein